MQMVLDGPSPIDLKGLLCLKAADGAYATHVSEQKVRVTRNLEHGKCPEDRAGGMDPRGYKAPA